MKNKKELKIYYYFNGPPLGVAVFGRALIKRLIELIGDKIAIKIVCSSDGYFYLLNSGVCETILIKNTFLDKKSFRLVSLFFNSVLTSLLKNRCSLLLMNPVVAPFFGRGTISVVHDLNEFIEKNKYGIINSIVRRFFLQSAIIYSSRVVYISDDVKNKSFELFGGGGNFLVINNGSGNDLNFPSTCDRENTILIVGRIDPNGKNLHQVATCIDIWLKQDSSLSVIFVGGINDATRDQAEDFINKYKPCSRIKFLGQVTDGELAFLYSSARFLLFLSVLEGFGMPPFEAIRANCPVVVHSSNSVIKDLIGNGVVYIDPLIEVPNFSDLCYSLEAFDFNILNKKIERYSWDTAAKNYALIIEDELND